MQNAFSFSFKSILDLFYYFLSLNFISILGGFMFSFTDLFSKKFLGKNVIKELEEEGTKTKILTDEQIEIICKIAGIQISNRFVLTTKDYVVIIKKIDINKWIVKAEII
jgi:hypothetical protein